MKHVEDFLVIKCVNGNHLFVSMSCTYKPTIMGFSCKALSTLSDTQSFEMCDQDSLCNKIEPDIREHELHADLCLSANLSELTRTNQLGKAMNMIELSKSTVSNNKPHPLTLSVMHAGGLTTSLPVTEQNRLG